MRILFIAALLLIAAAPVSAQNTIRGRALDDQDKPMAGLLVLLHRVTTTGGGGFVDTDTTDAQGAFELVAPPETDSSAIFFVAANQNGEMFMGDMQRLPFPDSMEYVIAMSEPVRVAEPIAPEDERAGLFVIIGGAVLVAGVLFFALRRRAPQHRRLLVELANLDDDDKSAATERRRQHLYARLKGDA